MFLNFSSFEPKIALKLFLNLKGTTSFEIERNVFKSLSLSYFIVDQIKGGTE